MKNILWTLAILLVGLFVVATLSGCKGPDGPAGPKGDIGANGTNGTNGLNAGFVYFEGFKDSLRCAGCHNADTDTTLFVAANAFQYELSGHKTLGNEDRNGTTCAGCHTHEGFIDRYNRGFATETFSLTAASGPMVYKNFTESSPPGCFTCHAPHKRGNFSMRDSSAVNIFTLVAGQTTQVWNSTAQSNLCVKCHQPRMTSTPLTSSTKSWQPDPTKTALTDTAFIKTVRYNNHVSGENVQNLLGFGGVQFAGYTYANSYHTTLIANKTLGCEDCHMATAVGDKAGGHTWKIGYVPEGSTTESFNLAGCNVTGCHSPAVTTTDATHWTIRSEILGLRAQLAGLLMDTVICKKWAPANTLVKVNGKSVPFVGWSPNAAGDTIYYSLTGNLGATNTTVYYNAAGVAYPLNANFGTLTVLPAFKAGAIWNLQQVLYDKSFGVHNYKYVKALLTSSIAELNK